MPRAVAAGEWVGPWGRLQGFLAVEELTGMLPGARRVPGQNCPQLAFGPERTIEKHMSASGRRSARQGRDRLVRTGRPFRVDRTSDPAEVRRLLPQFVAMHRARDHAQGRRSDLDSDASRLFYVRTVCRLAA